MDNERKQRDEGLGALWRKQGNGKPDFFTGSCICPACQTKTDIVVFENSFRTSDNHPEFRILKSKPREEGRSSTRRDEAQYQKPAPAKAWPARGQQQDPFERETQQPLARRATGPAPQEDWTKNVPHPVSEDEDLGF